MTGTTSAAANGMAATVADVIMLTRTVTSAIVSIPISRLLHRQNRTNAIRSAAVAAESQNGSVIKSATTRISACHERRNLCPTLR